MSLCADRIQENPAPPAAVVTATHNESAPGTRSDQPDPDSGLVGIDAVVQHALIASFAQFSLAMALICR